MEPSNSKRDIDRAPQEKEKKFTISSNVLKKGFVWRPVPTILSTTLCFLISGVIFIIIGAVLLYLATMIKEYSVRYDNLTECDNALKNSTNKTCKIEINLEDTFDPPVMVYYQLENFYQDHRRYIKSKSIDQLKGVVLPVDQLSDCDPITTVKDLGIATTIGGYVLNDTEPANPCGLIARSLFNDTYNLTKENIEYYINSTNISWDSDKKGRYKKPDNASKIQWTNVEDERFMVWMRPAGLPDFRKLWGRINEPLEPGKYELHITNNYQVASFGGKKSFVLSTVNALGGKNNFLGVAYLVVGCLCIVMALLFWVGYQNYNNDKKMKLN